MRSTRQRVVNFCNDTIHRQAALKRMKIEKIEKPKGIFPTVTKLRVAAYARVSTSEKDQLDSLAAQIHYYEKNIREKSSWVYSGIYYDEGITGTSYSRREGFQRMISDCEHGKIDMIITKSISRFARNTVDTIETVRKLKATGVGVFFEKENIWTLDSKGEFVLTLMAGFAQEEVRSLSENTAWGIRRRIEAGKYWVAYSKFLGYGPNFIIEEDGAEVVRFIFKSTIQGYSRYRVTRMLEERGIDSPGHKKRWHISTINGILQNEKYKGDALSQKQFTESFLTKKRVKNRGELPRYYVTGGHEPIIAPVLFDYVQELLAAEDEKDFRRSGCTLMSNKLICGKCGGSFGPKPIHSNDKYAHISWECRNKYKKGVRCKNRFFNDKDLPTLWALVLSEVLRKHPKTKKNVRAVFETIIVDEERLRCIDLWIQHFPAVVPSEIEMDEVAMFIECLTIDDDEIEIRLFGGKIQNMSLPLFEKRRRS